MTRRGTVLLCLGLLGVALFILWEVGAGSSQSPGIWGPGTWADPYFRMSEQDRQTYRPARQGRQLRVIVPRARDLDSGATGAGGEVPVIATAEIGAGDLSGIAMTKDEMCGGALRGMQVSAAARGHANPARLRNLFAGDPKSYRFWMSSKRDWVAMCDPKAARCEAVFRNPGWVADFPLEESGLCRAPAMNARFAALVEKWRRK